MRLVVLGRQGAGKGTQCTALSRHYGVPHISTGDMLREAVAEGTELGHQAKDLMDDGHLVPDDLMEGIVAERLAQPDAADQGFLLDGFPRTVTQADALSEMLDDRFIDVAANLDVAEDVVLARMLARGREDDTTDAIRRRLDLYEAETAPLLGWFEGHDRLVTVDGVGAEAEVTDRMVTAIDGRAAARSAGPAAPAG
jgi:adenylate kinase